MIYYIYVPSYFVVHALTVSYSKDFPLALAVYSHLALQLPTRQSGLRYQLRYICAFSLSLRFRLTSTSPNVQLHSYCYSYWIRTPTKPPPLPL